MSTRLRTSSLPVDQLEGDVIGTLFFSDQRPLQGPAALLDWRLNGALTDLLLDNRSVGKAGEQVLFRSNGKTAAEWILFFGGGIHAGLAKEDYRDLILGLIRTCHKAGFRRLALALEPDKGNLRSDFEAAIREELQRGEAGDLEVLLRIDGVKNPSEGVHPV